MMLLSMPPWGQGRRLLSRIPPLQNMLVKGLLLLLLVAAAVVVVVKVKVAAGR